MTLTDAEQLFLARQTRGHLATIGPDGIPQVKPLGFSYNPALGTIDIAGIYMASSAKYRNIRSNPHVAFVVDEVTAPTMDGAHFLEIRGDAEPAVGPHDPTGHLAPEIVRIHPRRVISFNVDPAHPGFAARDIKPVDSTERLLHGCSEILTVLRVSISSRDPATIRCLLGVLSGPETGRLRTVQFASRAVYIQGRCTYRMEQRRSAGEGDACGAGEIGPDRPGAGRGR